MPKLVYLLVQKSSETYQICDIQITHDISEVQELLDHASDAACQLLDSAQVAVRAYKLLNPVIWHEQSLNDMKAQLGLIDKEFLEGKVSPLFSTSSLNMDHVKLHVIILFNVSAKRPRLDGVDIIRTWMTNRHRVETGIPPVDHLRKLVEKTLDESEKIPITQRMFDSLIGAYNDSRCSVDAARSLFKIGSFDPGHTAIYYAVLERTPDSHGSESSFLHFWDSNIRKILEMMLPVGQSIRDSNFFTSTLLCRPDFAFLLYRVCAFRGEEKAPYVKKNPEEELTTKLFWTYDPAPYMLGYYCVGTSMTLTAITAPVQGKNPGRRDIISVDLKLREERIANIRHLINLSPLLPLLAKLVSSDVNDFQQLQRPNSTITLYPNRVVKYYQCHDAEQKVKHLKKIYKFLKKHSIPNTDNLFQLGTNHVLLEPRGNPAMPCNENELHQCLVCILETLIALHKIPLYHRDIRWPNVIRKIDNKSKWFLIDWEDAARPPTTAQISFTKEEHSPAVFRDGHRAEVDIWAVGYLIQTCATVDISEELRMLGKRICERSDKLSAKEVFELLNDTSG